MTNFRADYLTPKALSSMPFKSLGHDVIIHERVTLVGIENISIGSHVRIDPEVILLATGPLTIGCYIHIAVRRLYCRQGRFRNEEFHEHRAWRAHLHDKRRLFGRALDGADGPGGPPQPQPRSCADARTRQHRRRRYRAARRDAGREIRAGRAEFDRQIDRTVDHVWRRPGKAHQRATARRDQERRRAVKIEQVQGKKHAIVCMTNSVESVQR